MRQECSHCQEAHFQTEQYTESGATKIPGRLSVKVVQKYEHAVNYRFPLYCAIAFKLLDTSKIKQCYTTAHTHGMVPR